jgi:hypothetical protein
MFLTGKQLKNMPQPLQTDGHAHYQAFTTIRFKPTSKTRLSSFMSSIGKTRVLSNLIGGQRTHSAADVRAPAHPLSHTCAFAQGRLVSILRNDCYL